MDRPDFVLPIGRWGSMCHPEWLLPTLSTVSPTASFSFYGERVRRSVVTRPTGGSSLTPT